MHRRRLTDGQSPAPCAGPSDGRSRTLVLVGGPGAAAVVLTAAAGPGRTALGVPAAAGQAVVDLLLLLLAVLVLVLFVLRALVTARADRTSRGARAVAPWAVFAVAMAAYSTAQGRFAAIELLAGGDPRRDPATIGCYLVAAVVAPVAVALAVRAAHPASSRLRTLLDGLLAGGGLFVLSWLGVLGPALTSGDVPLSAVVFTAGTVLGAVVIVTASLALAVRCRPSASLVLLTAGSVVMAACQVTYLLLVRAGDFTPGGWISVGYVVALVAFVAAAVVDDGDAAARVRPRLRGPLAALPYLPLLVAVPAVLVEATRRQLGLVELGGTLLLTTVLVLRQALVVAENARLARELRERSAALAHLAYTDQLTGLANRTAFTGVLESALEAAAERGSAVVVAFCDLDGFKAVNDACGHAEGDALLVAVARRLRQAVRSDDVVARLGGDEFAVLVPDAGRAGDGARAAADLRDRLACALSVPFSTDVSTDVTTDAGAGAGSSAGAPGGLPGTELHAVLDRVSASVGAAASSEVATAPGGRVDAHALLREADHRMYDAKRVHHAKRRAASRSTR